MNLINAYALFVKHGNFTTNWRDGRFLGPLGLNGEAGEVAELFKKDLLHGKGMDRDELVKEMGDVLWYFFHICETEKITFKEIVRRNVSKLCDRWPDNYGSPSDWLPDA